MKKFLSVFLIITIFSFLFIYSNQQKINKEKMRVGIALEKEKEKGRQILKEVNYNYNEYVITVKDSSLYVLKDDKYINNGNVKKDIILKLDKKDNNNYYYKLNNLNYYILYGDVRPIEEPVIDSKYKNYIPFDFNIITKENTNLYIDEEVSLSINSSQTFSVIINDDKYYHVEFNNNLYKINKEEATIVHNKVKKEVATNIGVINYHFFYDNTKVCNLIICLNTINFEEQLKYLKDNKFYTASMKDISLWMERKIRLPKKTVVLTVDDGALGTGKHNTNKLIPLLEKYDVHATLFLITGWWSVNNYLSPNLEIQSHGDNIHTVSISTYKGLQMSKEELVKDFNTSIKTLNGENTAFCYPNYKYNNTMLSAVKEAGFKIAFIGGNRKINQNSNPYLLNRYIIYNNTPLSSFIRMVN